MTENRRQISDCGLRIGDCKKSEIYNPKSAINAVLRHLLFWPVFLGGLFLDLRSKSAVFAWLESRGNDSFSLINGWISFQLAENPGAAFGIAAGQRWLLVAVSIAALAVVLTVFLFAGGSRRIIQVALGLFAAGVSGNLYDRLFNNGRVRDFIDVVYWPGKHWPAFNAADSMLCIAVGLLIISSIFSRQSCRERARLQR